MNRSAPYPLTTSRSTASSSGESSWVETAGRFGYGVKGAVYGVVGILAVKAALGARGSAAGAGQAIVEIGQQPFGQVLLVVTALGLIAYSAWRFYQAVADPDDKGHHLTGVVKRVGFGISGTTYLLLAYMAGSIVLSGSGGGSSRQAWTAQILAEPFGQWIIGLIGAGFIGTGLYHFVRAYRTRFVQQYEASMDPAKKKWAKRIGRFGLAARAVTFLLIGFFLIRAGVQANASKVEGLGGALQSLASAPYGPWLLGVVAVGFVAYSVYCFSRARYRRFET